MLWTKFKLRNW